MLKQCANCKEEFDIPEDDIEFYRRVSPQFGSTRCEYPLPDLCPPCRMQRRIAWRNEFTYYRRSCSRCSKSIVSVHHPDRTFPVYCNKCWWSDDWDPKENFSEYDLSQSFFSQFVQLLDRVPQLAMMNDNGVASENCEYTNDFAFGKNCYLFTGSWQIRDSLYGTCCNHAQDMVDCYMVNLECELVYESVDSHHLYNCSFLQASSGCSDCILGLDLRGCKECLCCVGLRQKRFHIFNKPYSESEYRRKLQEYDLGSYKNLERLKREFAEFARTFPRKARHLVNCEDCHGDNLFNCRAVTGFDLFNAEFCKYFVKGDSPKNCQDIQTSGNCEWCYNCVTPDNSYLVAFSRWCWKDQHVLYSDNCHSSKNLFGCISLRRSEYCILNKQYSKDEYEALLPKIVESMKSFGEWGVGIPIELSSFAYNESLAFEHFPLTKAEVLKRGWQWRDPEAKEYPKSAAEPPDHIRDVTDAICQSVLTCSECRKGYKIIPMELAFYRKKSFPIPRSCPDCRRRTRTNARAPYKVIERECRDCKRPVESCYPQEIAANLLCESCYEKLVL